MAIVARLRQRISPHALPIFVVVFVIVNVALAYQYFLSPRPIEELPTPVVVVDEAPAGMTRSVLTGQYVPDAVAQQLPLAVMLDHFASGARPAAGINSAAVVYETLVEGGVTRLLALFQTDAAVEIGPVRSARDYFLPWAKDVGALYAHSGGSVAGLKALKDGGATFDADEFRYGSAYYRVRGRPAPHDLFTTTTLLTSLAEDQGWSASTLTPRWTFVDALPDGESATAVVTDFSLAPYKVRWAYRAEESRYHRIVGGAIATDRNTGEPVTAANVVVLRASVSSAPPPAKADAVTVATIGEGEAMVLRQGVVTRGVWKKPAADASLQLMTTDGVPIPLLRGNVWVAVVRDDKENAVILEP